jgi:uncharacterized integral membrane protein
MTNRSGSGSQGEEVVIGGKGVNARFVVGLAIVAGFLVFIFQNTADTQLRFLWLEFTMPIWGLALMLFAGGFIVGWLVNVRRAKRKKG